VLLALLLLLLLAGAAAAHGLLVFRSLNGWHGNPAVRISNRGSCSAYSVVMSPNSGSASKHDDDAVVVAAAAAGGQ
jgi:hypothetical protein